MFTTDNTLFDTILEYLFSPYRERVPDVQKISRAMIQEGIIADEQEIVNDHIAFRTLGVPNLGIASFEKIFLHHGYTRRDYHHFPGKKLDAYWYAPPSEEYPRIFISELRVQDLSPTAQEIIGKYTGPITVDPVDRLDLDDPEQVGEFFHKPLWELPTLEEYNTLAEESEYAAWVIYNRYYLNHYTLSVHEFGEKYNTVEKFNHFLEGIGIKLNTASGKVKVSEDGLLKQSSTVAKMIRAEFAGGETQPIPGSYVEFAERLILPEFRDLPKNEIRREHRRDGFESANADKIFESTYREQTGG
ncbi:DUF1338 domain-containing protein [Zeaxanthinibacter sp. PT1]|uniref:DUF1338 domain-containing protein n=1 Tax=Zeaxanthinibacter TaxID=561554 RepID=UPI00234ABF8A|nr:DUF1338 domain-containing protein [Zeaxanthinibacter sp. PT1]MDC6352362.1 DUF1338 domain-containing protein [Zeaxanthinibacter sp. PT1]